MVGAVSVSQCFDFGLIIPSTLLAVAIYGSANLARATASGVNRGKEEPDVFPSPYGIYWSTGLAGVVILLGCLATTRLHSDAQVETVAKHVSAVLPAVQQDNEKLAQLALQIRSAPRSDWSPLLLNALSKVQHAQARLADAAAQNPQTASEAKIAYQRSEITARRKEWYARAKRTSSDKETGDPGSSGSFKVTTSESANELYQSILNHSSQSLRQLPLGMEGRTWQLYLDFVHQDQIRSQQAIVQLSRIYKGNALMLERLGSYAATSGDVDLATRLWRQSLERSPRRALHVLDLIQAQNKIALLDVLPSDKMVFRRVTRRMIDQGKASPELLERAKKEILCDDCQTKREKANCHQLSGDIAYQLKDFDIAFDQLRTAIELTPTNSRMHLSYVQRLRDSDRRRDARLASSRARILFPKDNRFDRIIKEMAAEDLKEIEDLSADSILGQPDS